MTVTAVTPVGTGGPAVDVLMGITAVAAHATISSLTTPFGDIANIRHMIIVNRAIQFGVCRNGGVIGLIVGSRRIAGHGSRTTLRGLGVDAVVAVVAVVTSIAVITVVVSVGLGVGAVVTVVVSVGVGMGTVVLVSR